MSEKAKWITVAVVVVLVAAIVAGSVGRTSTKTKTETETTTVAKTVTAPRLTDQQLADVNDELTELRGKRKSLRSDVKDSRSELKDLKSQLGSTRDEVARSTVDGTGDYLVGEDIDPGTYRADAMPGCYYEVDGDESGENILSNDNADGPVIMNVPEGAYKVKLSDCAEFTKSQ